MKRILLLALLLSGYFWLGACGEDCSTACVEQGGERTCQEECD